MATQTYDPNRGGVATTTAAPGTASTRRRPTRVNSGPGALPASRQIISPQEISGGFATNPESAGMTFMKNGAFSNSSEALTAASAAGVHIGAGDIQNYFVSNSRYRPSVAETTSPGSTWQRENGTGVVAPTNPVNPTWNAPGSPGNEPGGAVAGGGLLTGSVTQNEIDNGFATNPDSPGTTFLQNGGFSNSSEALRAAREAGVDIGAGDIQNYFVSNSSVIPSTAETLNPGSTWKRQNVNGTNEVVAPTNPANSTWNAQGSPGNNPGGTGAGIGEEEGLTGEFIPAGTGAGSPGNNPGGTTVGEVGTDYGTAVVQPEVKAADTAMAVRSDDAFVENRMKGLLSEGGDWKRIAEHNGSAMANRRGLKDSSISASAAYGEAIKAALLIAQQDARTTANYDLGDQTSSQQALLANAEAENTAANLGYQTERGIEGKLQAGDQDFKHKGELNSQAFVNEGSLIAQKGDVESGLIGQRGDVATNLQNLKTQNAKDLLGIENEYKNTIATNSNASAIMQTYVNEIGDLMAADKKFTAEQIAERVRTLKSSLQGSLQVLSGVSGMDWTRFSIPGVAGPVGQNADVTNPGAPAPSILTPEQTGAVDTFLAAQGQPT